MTDTCEVDVFHGFEACDHAGVVVYEGESRTDVVMLCIGHAKQLAVEVEFGPESDS